MHLDVVVLQKLFLSVAARQKSWVCNVLLMVLFSHDSWFGRSSGGVAINFVVVGIEKYGLSSGLVVHLTSKVSTVSGGSLGRLHCS